MLLKFIVHNQKPLFFWPAISFAVYCFCGFKGLGFVAIVFALIQVLA